MECFALLDDAEATDDRPSSRLYTGFLRQRVCDPAMDLEAFWAEVEADLAGGAHALVLADYEWGVRLHGVATARPGVLRVVLFSHLRRLSAPAVAAWLDEQVARDAAGDGAGLTPLRPDLDGEGFAAAIGAIREAIAAGQTYQVNFSYRLEGAALGAPLALYRRLRQRQPVPYGAFVALPPGAEVSHVLSLSPELFVRHTAGRLMTRPMKGTAPRSGDAALDAEARASLGNAKNRAENLMIVDLLRNDLGRIARLGSVAVPELFAVEPFAAVFQMSSAVTAELPAATGFPAVLRALFPCGSVTGAPKHATLRLIDGLERSPRGLYCGAIGWIEAPAAGRATGDFCLSVAIRTLTLGAAHGGVRPARLGVGAGIVIDSEAAAERRECEMKAGFASRLVPDFSLIETLYASAAGVRHLDRHLARLAASAARLGFACPRGALEMALREAAAHIEGAHRLRLLLAHDGSFSISHAPLPPLPDEPVRVALAPAALDVDALPLGHKTTLRRHYDAALATAQAQGLFDVLFCNGRGELTEGARSNVFVRVDGRWLTPALGCGLLPGVMRGVLLDDPAWAAREAVLTRDQLQRAESIVVCNALRGALPARLV